MTVVRGFIAEKEFNPVDESLKSNFSEPALSTLFESVSVNSTAYEGETPKGVEFVGNKTECALLGFNKILGCDYHVALSLVLVNPYFRLFSFLSSFDYFFSLFATD